MAGRTAKLLTNISRFDPGITPVEFKVLVFPDEEPSVTRGGIIVPLEYQHQKQMAGLTGIIIAVADEAFSWMLEDSRRPVPGDRVAFTKYAGAFHEGRDKRAYRLMNDKDIGAIIEFNADE